MSENSLDKLIASLKSEAIEAAENESTKILEDARMEAQKILKEAEEHKQRILTDAENEAEATIQKGENALQQAARDLNIVVRNDLLTLFGSVLEREVRQEFTPGLIKSAVVQVIENIGSGVELKLSEAFEQELADYIHERLQSTDDLVAITKEDSVLNGLTITKTAEGWSYQISSEEIAALLQPHLTERWVHILKNEEQA